MCEALAKRAAEIMKGADKAAIAAIDGGGFPRVSTISSIRTDGIRHAWFTTGMASGKVQCFMNNPRAGLCYCDGGNNVTLMGTVEILSDPQLKKDLWLHWFIEHFPGGPEDPNYCILQFTTSRAVLWVDGQSGEIEVL